MKTDTKLNGHFYALITILIWGTTFISTKILLTDFTPIEILFYRFCIGYLALWIVCPRRLRWTSRSQELLMAAAGLCGITFYYLLENVALTYTSASNVGVIISAAPFFTALLANRFLEGERLGISFLAGFVFALLGISLISFNGSSILSFNPLGDFLALLAAGFWAVYSILSRKISQFGLSTIQTTRRVFSYGLFFMLLMLVPFDFKWGLTRFTEPKLLGNILFLGFGASALCFVTWNLAVKCLGAVKTSIYIYMVPVITIVTSVLILGETITWISVLGTALTLAGLFLSERERFVSDKVS